MFRAFRLAAFVAIFASLASASFAQSDMADRAELIGIQNAPRAFQDFERDSRHLFFFQATAIISFEGGWIEREPA